VAPELSVAPASIRRVSRTEHRTAATLPPVSLAPEEAAAVVVALAAAPDGPYADAGRAALEKVLTALEPDPSRRKALRETALRRTPAACHAPASASDGHPAGRARREPVPAGPPRLVVLRGGRQ
jgi:hypothetical protein